MNKVKVLFLITKSSWGETVWVRSDLMSLRKAFSEIIDLEKVDRFCKKTVARLALLFCEFLEQKSERVDSICKMVQSRLTS